jgi:hypothetical protein
MKDDWLEIADDEIDVQEIMRVIRARIGWRDAS